MKVFHLLLLSPLFFFSSSALSSQNYNPFPGDHWTYNFKYDVGAPSYYRIHSVRVDNIQVEGADTVYYFNPIVSYTIPGLDYYDCDSLVVSWPFEKVYNIDNVLGHDMHLQTDGTVIFVSAAKDSFILETQIPVGSKWLWNRTTGDSGTLVSKLPGLMYGVPDTILTYSVGGGVSNFQLSRDHGISRFYNLNLMDTEGSTFPQYFFFDAWGCNEAHWGAWKPGFSNYFNYDIGDHFQYESYYHSGSFTMWRTYNDILITSKAVNPDSSVFSYGIISSSMSISYGFMAPNDTTWTAPFPTTLTINRSSYPFLDTVLSGAMMPSYSASYDKVFATFGNYFDIAPHRMHLDIQGYYDIDTCAKTLILFETGGGESYAAGLGQTYSGSYSISSSSAHSLICYQKGTEVWGSCVDVLLTHEKPLENALRIFPNPVSENLFMEGVAGVQAMNWEVISSDGSACMSGQWHQNLSLNVSELPSGIYALILSDGANPPICRKFHKR